MSYLQRKAFYDGLLTIYGRKPVMEALRMPSVEPYRLHLAKTNRPGEIVRDITRLAENRGVEIQHHSREALSRISRNRKQDQGVALDINCAQYRHYQDYLQQAPGKFQIIALDGVTNPQNLGMTIRSVCASPIQGLLLPEKGCAPLSPLVIKASAGTLFQCSILRCQFLDDALAEFAVNGADICILDARDGLPLSQFEASERTVYVLGGETLGVSEAVRKRASHYLNIPMQAGVDSLNVAVTAGLLAFRDVIARVD